MSRITKEQFLTDGKKMWKDVLKRELTSEESEYAWDLFEREILSKHPDLTYEQLHQKASVAVTKKVTISSISNFNWVMTATYKKFNVGIK